MIKTALFSSVLLSSLLFLQGCSSFSADSKPSDTIVDPLALDERPDWIDESLGLYSREDYTFKDKSIHEWAKEDSTCRVYFGYDQNNLIASEREKLVELAEALKQEPEAEFLIVGHCDWHGTHEYNLALGDRRASSTRSYLVQMGVSPERFRTLSKGSLEAKPHAPDSQTQEDRRADIILMQ